MKPWLPFLLLFAAGQAGASAGSYTFDPEHTFPSFEIRHHGVSVMRGKFNRNIGRAVLDPGGERNYVELRVDASSADAGHAGLNSKLPGRNFFNTAQFPEIRFVATQIDYADGKPVAAHGELTMLGVTRPLSVEIRDFTCTRHFLRLRTLCGADVHATIRRTDFGMHYGAPMLIGDEVRLMVAVEAFRD